LVIENKAEEERAREAEKVQMQVMKDLAGLPRFTSECLDYLIVLLPCLYFHVRGKLIVCIHARKKRSDEHIAKVA